MFRSKPSFKFCQFMKNPTLGIMSEHCNGYKNYEGSYEFKYYQ